MTIPAIVARSATSQVATSVPALNDPAALRARQKQPLRRYQVMSLLPNGNVSDTRHIAPALPLFEDAFCAFQRGSLIETEHGPVAIEDLIPGDRIVTADGRLQTLIWKGSTMVAPARPGVNGRNMRLTRIMADAFGVQRPLACVVAGCAARILHTPAQMRSAGDNCVLTPVQEFIDGASIIETAPPTPIELFHICVRHHSTVRVGGLEFETYHPGKDAARMVSHSMKSVFFNLFSHAEHFGDFGPLAFPRSGDIADKQALIA